NAAAAEFEGGKDAVGRRSDVEDVRPLRRHLAEAVVGGEEGVAVGQALNPDGDVAGQLPEPLAGGLVTLHRLAGIGIDRQQTVAREERDVLQPEGRVPGPARPAFAAELPDDEAVPLMVALAIQHLSCFGDHGQTQRYPDLNEWAEI